MKELVYIYGPCYDYAEARDMWENQYGGDDGPYRLEEVREGVWYVVSDVEYVNVTDEEE